MWDGQCQFAIRGGGHTPFKGAASIDQGIVLDLLHLPTKGLSPDLGTVTVPPSLAWDMVYELLDEYSLSTLGTKVAGVGVGGAATSCGVSYFSPRYGFICDMVENYRSCARHWRHRQRQRYGAPSSVESTQRWDQQLWRCHGRHLGDFPAGCILGRSGMRLPIQLGGRDKC